MRQRISASTTWASHCVPATCAAAHLFRASGTLHWVLRLRHHLPRGTYIVYSQALGRNGKRETIRLSGGANVARVKVR